MLAELLHVGLVLAVRLPVALAVDARLAVAIKRAGFAVDVLHVLGLRLAGLTANLPFAVVPICSLNLVHVMVASSVP